MAFRSLKTFQTRVASSYFWLRCLSSAPHVTKLDSNIQIYQHDPAPNSRPMVLLFAWLFAKHSHLQKYRLVYMDQGFDVLTVQIRLGQVLLPRKAQKVMGNVLDTVNSAEYRSQPLLVHGFSVGAYLFGEMMVRVTDNPAMYSNVAERLYGQLLDSPADYYGIPKGFSRAMAGDTALQRSIQSLLELYMVSFPVVTKHYLRASNIFRENNFLVPGRFLYSLTDPVVEPHTLEDIAESWRRKGIPADSEFWDDAHHVSMFRKYPKEYENSIRDFVGSCGILDHNKQTAKIQTEMSAVN